MEESQMTYPQEEQQQRGRPVSSRNRPRQPLPQNLVKDAITSLKNPQDKDEVYQDGQPIEEELNEMHE